MSHVVYFDHSKGKTVKVLSYLDHSVDVVGDVDECHGQFTESFTLGLPKFQSKIIVIT